ncbi:MAG TPA: M14 family metallopeptidase [Tepidisphaeraceae bacterium]|nr:M14 family metallopeptidase [Tepidisphaeraceae bacterium]
MKLKSRLLRGNRGGPHLLITGGVHGDEYEPMEAVRRLMSEISEAKLAGQLTLVPVVNEPAFELQARTAKDGLDLARTCPGRSDGSITQRIAFALSEMIRSADFYIDLHTGGTALELYPLAGYMLHPDLRVCDVQRRMARAMNLPLVWGTSPNYEGRSLSVARDAGVPAIYAEYGGGGPCTNRGIDDYVSGCINVLRELGMLEGSPDTSRVRHVVEDPRDRSGYLQIQHPAPSDGFFCPSVCLGDQVQRKDVIGSVVDVLGENKEEIKAADDGIVVMLRANRRVQCGDALMALASTPPKGSI